jgi:hypothetical protein
MLRISFVAEELLVSHKQLCWMELVIIPAVSVLKTSKKKTLCIISNAVGVATG